MGMAHVKFGWTVSMVQDHPNPVPIGSDQLDIDIFRSTYYVDIIEFCQDRVVRYVKKRCPQKQSGN